MSRFAFLFLFLLAGSAAHAQQYPDRPIRFIVPFPAGDGIDFQTRLIGQHLTERWGQQILVENRPGAGTLIGTELATKAPHDGYTVLVVTTSFTINPSLHPKVPYDPLKDFTPLIQTTAIPLVVIGSTKFEANNFRDVMAMARQKPNNLTMGNSGMGTAAHIGMAMLDSMAGIQFLHVPYKGIPAATIDLLSGQLQMLVTSPAQVMGQIREGKVKALAVTGTSRMTQLPNVATVQEAGVAGYSAYAWIGQVVPAQTPKDIVAKLNREIASILNLPDIRTRLMNDGSEVVANTPEQFGAHIRSELVKWEKVIRTAGIKPN
ncbi:MAG: tripartite tricarboxylate transporter substrate binding protein [Candidatus Parcubacteria bacterium]|nr:tripartite tricarboxylate transporter substrate binding protein [Burkholderiales bacterium]